MFRVIQWLFSSVGPYLVGIAIGFGFSYLLLDHIDSEKALGNSGAGQLTQNNPVNPSVTSSRPTPEAVVPQPTPPKAESSREKATSGQTPVAAKGNEHAAALPEKATETSTPRMPTAPEQAKSSALPSSNTAGLSPPPAIPAPLPHTVTTDSGVKYAMGAPTLPSQAKTMETKPESSKEKSMASAACTPPSSYSGIGWQQYNNCLWRQGCLNQLASWRERIAQEKGRCTQFGNNAEPCLNYYRSLEDQYAGMCGQ